MGWLPNDVVVLLHPNQNLKKTQKQLCYAIVTVTIEIQAKFNIIVYIVFVFSKTSSSTVKGRHAGSFVCVFT